MVYLVANSDARKPAGERLRELLMRGQILGMPGAHNALAALQARKVGFDALYLSGAAMSASMGLPDLGILSVEDVCFFIRQIVRAADLPVLVDGDTGFGEVLNVMNTVRAFEENGAAAIQLEDQVLPKKCGHLNDKRLATPEDMANKVAAAAKARRSMLIVARTDAAASEGIDAAIERARLYVRAGADVIFPEALTTPEMFRTFAKAINVPLLANMTEFGRTPYLTAEEFQELGYKIVIWPVSSLRVAAKAQEGLYTTIRHHGGTTPKLGDMQTRAELYDLISYSDYEALDAAIVRSAAPELASENVAS